MGEGLLGCFHNASSETTLDPGHLLQCSCSQRSKGSGKRGGEEEESQVHPSRAQSPLSAHSSGVPWCVWPRSPQFHTRPQTTHHRCHPGAPLPLPSSTENRCSCSGRECGCLTGLHGGGGGGGVLTWDCRLDCILVHAAIYMICVVFSLSLYYYSNYVL